MYGAILGDMIGAPYEFDRGNKTKDFPLFSKGSHFTDDTVMTIAVADALLDTKGKTEEEVKTALVQFMQKWGRKYPNAGYGARFYWWLKDEDPQPYGSWGNGSAMRVSSAGWLFDTLEETRRMARMTAEITHNHPEGIKGAEAAASAIFLARTGSTKEEIKEYIVREFGYDLSRTCDEIRPGYHHIESCQETVPEAITAFLEGNGFEDVIRTAVSLGGDCDTLTCIAGGIAEAFYVVPEEMKEECRKRLPEDMREVLDRFTETVRKQEEAYDLYLEGNEEIGAAIGRFYKNSSRKTMTDVLDAIRQRMNEEGKFIVPVEVSDDRSRVRFRSIMNKEGELWEVVFTSREELHKGAPTQVLSLSIEKILEDCIRRNKNGFIIDPWGQSFVLRRELIELLFEADQEWKKEIGEKLDDGSLVKKALLSYEEKKSFRSQLFLLRTLRSSCVWVPCTAIMSEEDEKRFEEMFMGKMDDPDSLEGEMFTSKDEIRLRPDILISGEESFFPVFTSEEEMGEYGEGFSKIQRYFPEVLPLARNNEQQVAGIVINAFTEPYVLSKDLFDYVEGMKPFREEED